MSLAEIFLNAATKAQQKQFCHKKLMKLVENAFDNSKLEELYKAFLRALYRCYYSNDYADKNPYVARGLEFLAEIVMKITLKCVNPMEITDANGTVSQVYDITLDPFFNNVLSSSVKFACVEKSEVRFNTCYFIMTLLQCIGNNVEMDQSVCNIILDSLVELLHDPKANIRIQAIKALVRLQEPSNADCLVLKSFWILSTDPNSEVRKSVISYMAPHPQSFIKIRNRLTDTDQGVKQAAFTKFADINPKLYLKIIDRNIILTCGLADKNKKIQHIMTEKLLPKWLSYFKGNYLLFFRALRLDADENDINNFEKLCTELLEIFSRAHSLTDLVKYLPINKEDKLIPSQQLRLESVFYWAGVISYLRKTEDGEEYLESILPELTSFSNYIERVIKEKSSVAMDEWENLEFQNILYQLFKISSGFDMSDEAGRKTFYALILQILTTNKFQQKVIDQILQVASLLNTNKGSLSIDLCQVISEIREPLMDELPSEEKLRKQNFEMTQLRVKIHQLEIDEEEALKKKDFQHAHIVQNEIEKCQKELDSLKNMYVVSEKVRVSKDDPETLCRCLDILIGLLKITDAKDISPALQSCRDEFLMPLLSNNNSEVHWRFILCLGLFSLMDKELAFKHANFLCLPIATYRAIANYDKVALKTSVACVSDLIRMYGVKVIGVQENSQSEQNQDSNPTTSRRKLYSEDLSEPEILSKDDITIEFIIDIILDMLDDEDEGVRLTASTSICRLIVSNFPVSSELICRLILKWYNPETEKKDVKLHKQLGIIIECFVNNTKGAKKVVQKAILPIISSIVNASGTSPLLEIDMENVLRFLAAITNTIDDNDNENIHNEIAVDLIERMLNKPNDACVPYLVKLLTYLELKFQDMDKCRSLITSIELLIADIVDKIPRKNLMKLRDKLVAGLNVATIDIEADRTENQTANGLTSITDPINGTEENIEDQSSLIRHSAVNGGLENAISEIDSDNIQKGSRVSDRLNKSKSASRKQLDFSSSSDETILKTFLQGDEEFQVLEDISVENISNNSSNLSGDSKKENLSIDVSTSSSSTRRSSRRKRCWREVSPDTESRPTNKIMKTEHTKNLQRVGR
ncbi:condensin complex subunit 3-like isoform X2 [Coccinella septempunctata]|uniref:condensin complex subunit 3-like isoform X2 n=1 Tax=Coccinella septempunctata TaxID=41139 RepID=UPI001D097D09|nr:condensin complex subunit 3-like isoform X2 [Coccinella septempunctata]